jgi:hypothetical protein
MIQVTPQMRILVAVEPVDFRRGIDGLARLCRPHCCTRPPKNATASDGRCIGGDSAPRRRQSPGSRRRRRSPEHLPDEPVEV